MGFDFLARPERPLLTVLDVLAEERLQDNARRVGNPCDRGHL